MCDSGSTAQETDEYSRIGSEMLLSFNSLLNMHGYKQKKTRQVQTHDLAALVKAETNREHPALKAAVEIGGNICKCSHPT